MNSVPKEFQALFPSVSVKDLDVNKDRDYIVEQLLKTATLKAWQWMVKEFSGEEIARVVKNSNQLGEKDVNFWSLYYNIPKTEIKCLQKKYRGAPKVYWQN